jgi:hypothetical protein
VFGGRGEFVVGIGCSDEGDGSETIGMGISLKMSRQGVVLLLCLKGNIVSWNWVSLDMNIFFVDRSRSL